MKDERAKPHKEQLEKFTKQNEFVWGKDREIRECNQQWEAQDKTEESTVPPDLRFI